MTLSFTQALGRFSPRLPLAVAYSGGADSTALLVACAQKWPQQVSALHVHHGVQAAGDAFEAHCQQFCAALNVPLLLTRVDGRHAAGQSPEDAARRARYKAFEALALVEYAYAGIKSIAIAQHADDQVETLLLALSRGAGLPGLSGMAAQWQRNGLDYHRPLLQVAGADLRAWLQQQGLSWIEDPSNTNPQLTRNRIRAQLLPALQTGFPQFRDTFSRSAAHAAQAQAVLDEVAAQDLAVLGEPLKIRPLQALSRARQANVLRYWLRTCCATQASAAQLAQLQHQIAACTTRGHQIRIKVGQGVVVREGLALRWYNPQVLL